MSGISSGLSACLMCLAIALASSAASAQLKSSEPAAKATKQPVKKTAPKSACQGLDQTACTIKATECHWIREAQISSGPQKGLKRTAHCAKLPSKKTEVKKSPTASKAPDKK